MVWGGGRFRFGRMEIQISLLNGKSLTLEASGDLGGMILWVCRNLAWFCFSGDFLAISGLTKVPFRDYFCFFLGILKQIQAWKLEIWGGSIVQSNLRDFSKRL